ncbi:tetratricopeptide repeat protein [bacterium]|nr:tetratricopeptide repeat protein [bacterium]
MKKLLLCVIILAACSISPVLADEIEEDYLDIAASYCIMGDYNSALEYLDKILTINPSSQQVISLKKGLNHIISQDKKTFVTSVSPLVKQAQEYKRVGDEKMELSTLQKASQAENAYLAYYYLGNFYRSKNNYQKALDAYNSSVSARPNFSQAYLASAILLYDIGRYSSVMNPIDKYLTFNPEDDLAYAIKSRAEFETGMLEEAKKDNDKALELNDCPEYRFDKAKILYKYGQFEESKAIFSELLSDIQTSKIYEYMGLCDYAAKNYLSALSNIDKAIILSDDDEYLESMYNEIKEILENKQYETTQD